ncbi:MAG: hypothetical protein ACE5E9_08050 [Nitrospinaceae bacterium]
MKIKKGTWPENIQNGLLAVLSAIPLGYVAIVYLKDWFLSFARAMDVLK